jgi:FkbH-like protein
LERVVQLIGKTNQFNLTSRRHSSDQVRQLLNHPATIGQSLRLTDRFGDYGLVSVLLAVENGPADPQTLRIDTWLMSCRVIGRTAEEFFFNMLLQEARRRGVDRLLGEYIPTAKNGLTKDLYDRLGFTKCPPDNGTVCYELRLTEAQPAKTFVRLQEASRQ